MSSIIVRTDQDSGVVAIVDQATGLTEYLHDAGLAAVGRDNRKLEVSREELQLSSQRVHIVPTGA